jgi:thiol-disulfide isomerase/thioredoxin
MKNLSISQIATMSLALSLGFAAINPFPIATVAAKPIRVAAAGALASELQGKPVVVDIYASWCPGCRNIAPTLQGLKTRYQDKANFVVFDVSDKKTTAEAAAMAKKLGLTNFFNANKASTSTVAIIDPANGKILKQFRNNANASDYAAIIDAYVAKGAMGNMAH